MVAGRAPVALLAAALLGACAGPPGPLPAPAAPVATVASAQSAAPVAAAGPLPPAAAPANAPVRAFARIDDSELPVRYLELFLADEQVDPHDAQAVRRARDWLIDRRVQLIEAARQGWAPLPDLAAVRTPEDFQQQQKYDNAVLLTVRLNHMAAHPVSDAEARAEYDRRHGAIGDQEYKLHRIRVATEAEARDIIARVERGERFEYLARRSEDALSAGRGGELDWAPPGAFMPAVVAAIRTLQPGQTTHLPVHAGDAWFVLRLDDVRPEPVRPFEAVRERVKTELSNRAFRDYVQSLRAGHVIEILDAAP